MAGALAGGIRDPADPASVVPPMDRRTRAQRASETLNHYNPEDKADPHTQMVDLLTDLMHFAKQHEDCDFNAALTTATMHFVEEVSGEDGGS